MNPRSRPRHRQELNIRELPSLCVIRLVTGALGMRPRRGPFGAVSLTIYLNTLVISFEVNWPTWTWPSDLYLALGLISCPWTYILPLDLCLALGLILTKPETRLDIQMQIDWEGEYGRRPRPFIPHATDLRKGYDPFSTPLFPSSDPSRALRSRTSACTRPISGGPRETLSILQAPGTARTGSASSCRPSRES